MKLKRFVAADMRSALAKIKEELGAEAVIMSNKRVANGVEIIAGVETKTVSVEELSTTADFCLSRGLGDVYKRQSKRILLYLE